MTEKTGLIYVHVKHTKIDKNIQKHLDKSTSIGYNSVVVIKEGCGNAPNLIRIAEKWSVHNMFETLKKLLVDELQIDPKAITADAELSSDLGINSIELANLIMICEEKFDITIDDDDIHKLVTVGDVVSYLESLK